ncbi:MAG: hypothetical protein IJZ74_02800 [Clostridia bacterium]|nr:hypothetical protein [Clostridia bacterium]
MCNWHTDRQGFVTHYMVSGPQVTEYTSDVRDKNQLRYEAYLRSIIATHAPVEDALHAISGENSRLGLPWRFYGGHDAAFVNLSDFYSLMRRVRFDVATVIIAPRDMQIQAVLWSYAAVDLYCNGTLAGRIDAPVYKPIHRAAVTLPLKAGRNVIYMACETLGVRDTRSVVSLQLPDADDQLRITVPDEACAALAEPALALLEGAMLHSDRLTLPCPAPAGCEYTYHRSHHDFALAKRPVHWISAEGMTDIPLQPGEPIVTLRVHAGSEALTRRFERTEQIQPKYVTPTPSFSENLDIIYKRIGDVESLSRGEKFGFPISQMLARKHTGDTSRDEQRLFGEMLDLIESRVDCSDFLMCGLTRYLHHHPVEGELKERIRSVLLGYRYWMDQDGFDGMCFWSENHCLMFYASAMAAGELYPDDHFVLAGMSGRELYAWGRGKVIDWLDDVEKYGFEEFLSTVYMCVTFAALINVIDFSEPEISCRASKVTDQLLEMLSLHTYKSGIVAPQGRVYRSVLYPFAQGAMALMNLIDPRLPYEYGEGWLGFYATSKYRIPDGLIDLMEKEISTTYTTGNSRIVLEKHPDWLLTSVVSPREDAFERWENETLREDADPSTHSFVKSYNECFHGTTCFEPGTCGYQQHMWHAALDGEAAIFVNHPGSTSEGGDMRPGYWHGNGVMPALRQQGNMLGMIYRIPEAFPIHYIHLYAPECRFEEIRREDGWLFLRKGSGYLAFWSSIPMESWNGMNFNCEQRMYGDDIACLCICGGREHADMQAFIDACKACAPVYDAGELHAGSLTVRYEPGCDRTQFL